MQKEKIDNLLSDLVIDEAQEEDGQFEAYMQPDQNEIQKMIQESSRLKSEFQQSAEFKDFNQLLIISQIRMDFTNDDPFFKHIMNVEEAIKKGIRNILISMNKIQKQQFKNVKNQLIKLFYEDINIGFITSTGQIKSTAFIFAHKQLCEDVNRKKINFQFKKIPLKITLTFFAIDKLQFIQPQAQLQMDPRSAFIRNNKFQNEYLILSQTNQDELRCGISIYFAYRPIDDQIYAVKRSKLETKNLDFFQVFQTGQLQINPDLRKIREAKILSKLTHPNILRLYNWWIENVDNQLYLYMQLEYCSFPGFKYQPTDLLTFSYYFMNPMSNNEKIVKIKQILSQILDGLEYIHKRGIIHRDLKPENIFVTISITGDLLVMLADFDQGKDVREHKLSAFSEDRLTEEELNSIKSQNTITTGTTGYQTENYNKDSHYDMADEFYALGIIILHLVIAFPGEPKNRNHYAKTFTISDQNSVAQLFDSWASKFVKNKNNEFSFKNFTKVLDLARILITHRDLKHIDVRNMIMGL